MNSHQLCTSGSGTVPKNHTRIRMVFQDKKNSILNSFILVSINCLFLLKKHQRFQTRQTRAHSYCFLPYEDNRLPALGPTLSLWRCALNCSSANQLAESKLDSNSLNPHVPVDDRHQLSFSSNSLSILRVHFFSVWCAVQVRLQWACHCHVYTHVTLFRFCHIWVLYLACIRCVFL